ALSRRKQGFESPRERQSIPPTLLGRADEVIECNGHHWARELGALGHEVRRALQKPTTHESLKTDLIPRVRLCSRGHQCVMMQPGVIFFSAAYFAAASLTMGAIMESSAMIQSDAIFHFLPSQVWMRPVRVPS